MFKQFMNRPIRTDPEDLNVMQPVIVKRMSRRDYARLKFIDKRRRMMKINNNPYYKFLEQRQYVLDVQEHGITPETTYKQITESISKQHERLEAVDNPIIVHKSYEDLVEETKK